MEKTAGVCTLRRSFVVTFSSSTDFEQFAAAHSANLGLVKHLDVFAGEHAAGEIIRHALAQVVSAHDEQDFFRAFGKKHRGLPGGISRAGDETVAPRQSWPFERGRGVVDAVAFVLLATFRFERR